METLASMPSLRLVVTEDDPSIRQFLVDAVQRAGHDVVAEATHGNEMVQIALETEFDLILFDIHLPLCSGLEALRQISQQKKVAAVAITADHDQELLQHALSEAVQAYLVKPVEEHQLNSALLLAWTRFSEHHQLAKENATLRQTLEDRKIIERAKGILMQQNQWTESDAFKRMRTNAMNRRISMAQLAREILEGSQK